MNKVKTILDEIFSKKKIDWELLAFNNPTKLIINQTMKGINIPDVILIVNHFFAALII